MKKGLTKLFIFICVVVFVAGCSKEPTYQSPEVENVSASISDISSLQSTEVENVSISISDISSTGATVIIKDSNEEPHIYGEWYNVEKEENGKWYELKVINESYVFNSLGYLTNDNGEVKFTVNWERLYGELPAGNYRLLKKIDSQYISVEFRVEEIKSQ